MKKADSKRKSEAQYTSNATRPSRRGLGRGLSALISHEPVSVAVPRSSAVPPSIAAAPSNDDAIPHQLKKLSAVTEIDPQPTAGSQGDAAAPFVGGAAIDIRQVEHAGDEHAQEHTWPSQSNATDDDMALGQTVSSPASWKPDEENSEPSTIADDTGSDEIHSKHESLSSDSAEEERDGGVQQLSLDLMAPNPKQPRQDFDEDELRELADSILTLGVLQPILVRPLAEPNENGVLYEIIAGERRWRAAHLAQLAYAPVIIRHFSEQETLEVALVENVQRSNLNPIEEAEAYQKLCEEFGLTQNQVSERVGKDRASVANYMRLLKLSPSIKSKIREGKLSMGHARALLGVKDPSAQARLGNKVIEESLSVRALEGIISRTAALDGQKEATFKGQAHGISGKKLDVSPFPEVVDRMRRALGTKVNIRHHQSGRGRIEIDYFSEVELDRVVDRICQ